MVRITADLIRKKSEHNEGTMPELEEISLHQLEIERIENIDTLCRKLRILYLQNNIINKMENLKHLKDLQYLNLALNNIKKIEGLDSCEFLNKLDLTVNFIGLEHLKESMENLAMNKHLKELYIVGNPCCDWEGCKDYIVAKLPNLQRLDGLEITRSLRILALQKLNTFELELEKLAKVEKKQRLVKERREKESSSRVVELDESNNTVHGTVEDVTEINNDEPCEHTPEVRTQIYREMAEEKEEKERREKERLPKERNWEKEHEETVEKAMSSCFFDDGRVRQCNDGKLDFLLDEDQNHIYLTVQIARFVDTSLVECDVQPNYVTVIVKNKVLRLATPEEVKPDSAKSERSITTGELKVTMPKLEPKFILSAQTNNNASANATDSNNSRVKRFDKPKKLGEDLLASVNAIDLKTMYKGKENPNMENVTPEVFISEVNPTIQKAQAFGVPDLE